MCAILSHTVRVGVLRPGERAGFLLPGPPGNDTGELGIGPGMQLCASIRVEGSTWSDQWQLIDTKHDYSRGPTRASIAVVDSDMRPLVLMLETSRLYQGMYQLTCYVSVWVVNLTGLALSYRPSGGVKGVSMHGHTPHVVTGAAGGVGANRNTRRYVSSRFRATLLIEIYNLYVTVSDSS
jgi:hypothetical protein